MNMYTQDTLFAAKEIARLLHKDQKYGVKPYTYHLSAVDSVAVRFGFDDNILVRTACYLHDVVEDTDTSLDDIEKWFDEKIRDVIDALTDREGEDKREVFQRRTQYSKLAILVKMFDRIANIEACLAEDSPELLKRYISEHHLFDDILNAKKTSLLVYTYLDELVGVAQRRLENEKKEE